ncbi:hypothetical protein Leryth_015057, partial [Lithospermum erythrorhizon]
MFPPPPSPPPPVTVRRLTPPNSTPTTTTSLLLDPTSLSLALSHQDTSFSLYPSLSSPPTHLPPPLLIPSPTSSATFLHLSTTTIFLVSSHTNGGTAILLRFYMQNPATKLFKKVKVVCNHRDLEFDEGKNGVVFRVGHGVCVRLVGGVNVFVLYSVSNSRIWVFSVRMVGDEVVKLMKSAVIECCLPVFSIGVAFGYMVLGEENGVRAFPLQRLVKGRVKREVKSSRKVLDVGKVKKLNGLINGINGITVSIGENHGGKNMDNEGSRSVNKSKVALESKSNHSESTRLRTLKVRQVSEEVGACFVELKREGVELSKTMKKQRKYVKAISIQSLSPKKFLILDSVGELHLLHLSQTMGGSNMSHLMKTLPQSMKVERLAVFPDISSKNGTVWISDGHNSIHMMELSDMDTSGSDDNKQESDEQKIQISGLHCQLRVLVLKF